MRRVLDHTDWRRASTATLGERGERLAARYCKRAGMQVLARRLATAHGELDLVLARGTTLVVVEVKAGRVGPLYRPADRVRPADGARLWRAAHALARRYGYQSAAVEVIEVRLEPGDRRPKVLVLPLGRPSA